MNENKNQRLGLGIFENGKGSLFVQPRVPQDEEPNRIQKLVLSFILGLGLLAALMALFQQPFLFDGPQSVAAATLCVNTTGTGGCYTKIQDAIDAASQGDVITVDAGTYNEHITMTNGVSIHGQGWPSTIIDGGYSMPRATVYIPPGVSASTVLSGVQITGGGTGVITTSVSAYVQGGGIQIGYASPSIVNTWVYSCTAKEGGGVFVNGGSPSFDNVPVWNSQAERGGGFYLQNGAEVTITSDFVGTNGTVQGNSALQDGGGIYMTNVTATLSGLRIWWNTASGTSSPSGGGAYISNTPNRVTLRDNWIWLNSAKWGGGINIYNATNLEIVDNEIWWNTASLDGGGAAFSQSAGLVQTNGFIGNSSGGAGGGVTVFSSSTGPTLQGNWFQDNSAGAGGGLNLDTGAAPLVDANSFVTNTASIGGGIYLYQAGTAKMTNNIVARNISVGGAGGGVVIVESPGQLINNTIAGNSGDGVFFAEAEGVTIVNNIISGNSDDGIEHNTVGVNPTISYTVDYNDLYNNTGVDYAGLSAGAHDMSVDPQFVAAGVDLAAYYHITNTSPVSATGSISWAPQRDIDGDLRISGGSVSMGADEFAGGAEYPVYLPLILRSS